MRGAVNNDASTDNFTDITPDVQFDNSNAWFVIWSRNQSTASISFTVPEIFYAYSLDGLVTWSFPQQLGNETGCKPRVLRGSTGQIGATWETTCSKNVLSDVCFACT